MGLVFHCSDRARRERIESDGLRPMRHDLLFVWPTLEAAHAYRFRMNASGWVDVWAFDDDGESRESPAPIIEAGATARVLDRPVPPDRLELVYAAH